MKILILISMLFCAIVFRARAELTPEDLNKIRLILNDSEKRVKEEIKTEVKAEIANFEKNIKEYVDIKFESIDKQITHVTYITYGLIALIVAAIGIPQIIMAWRSENNRDQAKQIQELR